MSKAPEEALVLRFNRERNAVDGLVQGSDPEQTYVATMRLQATLLCSCAANSARDSRCRHLRALLDQMDEKELREFILDAQRIPIDP